MNCRGRSVVYSFDATHFDRRRDPFSIAGSRHHVSISLRRSMPALVTDCKSSPDDRPSQRESDEPRSSNSEAQRAALTVSSE